MKDLQKLKDNVDQLRKMCTDCTVSQSERECERQRERENEKLNEETGGHGYNKNWMNERNLEKLNKFRHESKTDNEKVDINTEKILEEDGDTDSENRPNLEESERKKYEAERVNTKENEKEDTLKKGAEKDGKTPTEWTKRKNTLGLAKVPAAGGKESRADMANKKVDEKNNKETERDKNKEKVGKGDKVVSGKKADTNIKNRDKTQENDRHVRQDETKETGKKTQIEVDRESDGIKMSEENDEHTDEDHGEERKKEMEKGVKTEQNNEKSKDIESTERTEREKTIKEGVVQREDRETGKEIKITVENTVQTVQRDGDGELASVKATERPDFVSISPAPILAPKLDSMDSNKATFSSFLPFTPLSVSTLNVVTDLNHGNYYEQSTQQTIKAGIAEHQHPDAKTGFRTASRPTSDTMSTLGGPGQQITRATARFTSTANGRPAAGFQGPSPEGLTTATITPSHNLYTTTFPGVPVRSRWVAKKNITLNAKTVIKPLPGRGPKPGENLKPRIKPEVAQKAKHPKNDRKPDLASLPDKKTKHEQKQNPIQQKPPNSQKSKPGKETKHVETSKPDQKALPHNITTIQKLKNDQMPKLDQARKTGQSKLPNQKPNSLSRPPVQKSTSEGTVTSNTFGSDKDPLSDKRSAEIPIINQNSKPNKNLQHPLKTGRPNQKPEIKTKSEEKRKPNQKPEPIQRFTPVQEFDSVNPTPKPNQESVTKLKDNEKPSPGPKNKEDSNTRQTITLDPKPEHSQKIPKINQKPKSKLNQSDPELVTDRNTKPNVRPKLGQALKTNKGLKTSDQMPNFSPKIVPESNKTAKTKPPPRHRPPGRPVLKPGATAAQSPKPALHPKPSPKANSDLDLPHITMTTSGSIQNAQTDMLPTSGPTRQAADVTQSPGDTKFSQSIKKTATLGPKTYNSLESGSFPYAHLEDFATSTNSRMTSDQGPQTASQPSSSPVTRRPNNGIFSSVIPNTSPEPTEPNLVSNTHSSSQAMEKISPSSTSDPVPAHSSQTTSVRPELRSTIPDISGSKPPEAEFSTASPRELRVKINQVAALLNNSLTPKRAPLDSHPKEDPEDNQGGNRPDGTDSKPPTRTSSKGKSVSFVFM